MFASHLVFILSSLGLICSVLAEPWQGESHETMLAKLKSVADTADTQHPLLNETELRNYQAFLDSPATPQQTGDRIAAHYKLAERQLDLGREEEALGNYAAALELANSVRDRVPVGIFPQLHYGRAVGFLRKAELL